MKRWHLGRWGPYRHCWECGRDYRAFACEAPGTCSLTCAERARARRLKAGLVALQQTRREAG